MPARQTVLDLAVRAEILFEDGAENAVLGEKRRGMLDPELRAGVLPGAITDWDD